MNWKEILAKSWKWAGHNRFTVITPVLGLILWFVAVGCTLEVVSPLTGRMVNASQLQVDYDAMVASFKLAGEDLERQVLMQAELTRLLLGLASGSIANWSGLLQILLGTGLLGLAADNIRKNGVIGGLKRNK